MIALCNYHTEAATTILQRENLPPEVFTAQNSNGWNALIFALLEGYTDIAANILQRDNLPAEVFTVKIRAGMHL